MKKLTANQIKDQVLQGKKITSNGWSIHITAEDKVAIWPPKGDGFQTSLSYLDKAIKDFCKSAEGMPAPKVNKKPIPQGATSNPDLGKDSTEDDSWGKVKVNTQPKPQGNPSNKDLGEDSTSDEGFKSPSVNTRPEPAKGRGGLPNTDLGADSSSNVKFAKIVDTFDKPVDRAALYRKTHTKSPSAELLSGICDPEYWTAKVAFGMNEGDDDLSEIVDIISYSHPEDAYEMLLNMGVPPEVVAKALSQSKGHGARDKDIKDLSDAFGVEGETLGAPGKDFSNLGADIDDFADHGGISYKGSAKRVGGPRLKENWGDGGAYNRDLEAETAEELHALVRGFNGEEVDWSIFKNTAEIAPAAPAGGSISDASPEPQGVVAKVAVDDKAKTYYEEYFQDEDYGKKLVKDVLKRDKQIDKEEPGKKEKEDKKEAQMAPGGAQGPMAPKPIAPAAPGGAPAAPGAVPPKAPGSVPPPAPGGAPVPGGAGDSGLLALGWTNEDVQLMTPDEKQKVLQIQLNKPGTKKPAIPGQPEAPKAPGAPGAVPPPAAPGAPKAAPPGPPAAPAPSGMEAGCGGKHSAYAEKLATILKVRRAQQELAQAPAPVANPVQTPGAPKPAANPDAAPEFAEQTQPQSDPYADMATTVFSVYSQIRATKVQATSPEDVATQKAEMFIKTLLNDYGINVRDAVRVLGSPNSSPVSLFK